MKYIFTSLIVATAILLTGCVHLPSIYGPTGNASKVSHSAVANVTKASTAKQAIQTTFNWFATVCVLGGLACLALGGLSIYRGLIVSGIKFIIGGILLPIAGLYIAYHWLLIVSLCLIAVAVYLTITYWAGLTPLLSKVEADVHPLLIKLGLVKAPAAPVATVVPAVAPTTSTTATK